jgi:hypothetical protein
VLDAGIDVRSNCTSDEFPRAMFNVTADPKFVPGAPALM